MKMKMMKTSKTVRLLTWKIFHVDIFPLTENICQQINNLCTQICVPTKDNSYVCQCHDGYVLLEDTITCVKKEMIDNNISTENNSSEWVEIKVFNFEKLQTKKKILSDVKKDLVRILRQVNVKISMNVTRVKRIVTLRIRLVWIREVLSNVWIFSSIMIGTE